jgi:hydrogenase nickel incorporation protein HypA/HybF
MHELGITQEIVAIACERAGGARVRRIVIVIGKLSAVLPDAVRFCFDLCSDGTPAEGAALEIIEPPGRASCRDCRAEVVLEGPLGRCECGSVALDWLSGDELAIKELEIT